MFSIGAPSAQPAAGSGQACRPRRARAALWAAKVVIYVGLFVGVGGAFFRAWIADLAFARGTRRRSWRCSPSDWSRSPVSVGLQGLDALELPLSGLQQKAAWEAGLETAYGLTAIAAAVALFAGLFAVAAKSARVGPRPCRWPACSAPGSRSSLSGHASTAEPRLVSRPAVFVHAVCVAFWIGALLPLLRAVRAARLGPPQLGTAARTFFARDSVPRSCCWSRAGSGSPCVQLGRIDALWTTSYGQVLACKLACVAVLAGAGRGQPLSAGAELRAAAAPRPPGRSRPRSRSSSSSRSPILALVALWRFTPPPRALAAAAPISIHLHGEKAMAEIEIERRGRRSVRGRACWCSTARSGRSRSRRSRSCSPIPPPGSSRCAGPRRRAGESSWRIDDLRIPVAGRWNVRVEILISDFEKVTIEDTVALPRMP